MKWLEEFYATRNRGMHPGRAAFERTRYDLGPFVYEALQWRRLAEQWELGHLCAALLSAVSAETLVSSVEIPCRVVDPGAAALRLIHLRVSFKAKFFVPAKFDASIAPAKSGVTISLFTARELGYIPAWAQLTA